MERIVDFIGGESGPWAVRKLTPIIGESLPKVDFISIIPSSSDNPKEGLWRIRGVRSNLRYTEKSEESTLLSVQADLGRPEARLAALIPIRKSETWWKLAQDERREIFEADSGHIKRGLKYLPAIARRLFHCRDFEEQFDFMTWFEYSSKDSDLFEELVAELRETQEWKYVERELDIRLIKI